MSKPATTTEHATGGYSMARQLVGEGVEHVFGIPGVQLDYATNGLAQFRDELQFINVRHEQTATYAADGYARSTGRVGVALVVPGPGVLNAASGLVTALACSSRVLLIAGQIPTRHIGAGFGLLHEIPDQAGLLASLCRHSTLVTDAGQVAGALHGAMVRLGSGPGPVAVELPPDVLSGRAEGGAIGREPAGTPSAGSESDLAAVAERLAAGTRPVIYAGGGAREADTWDELAVLAQTVGAALVSSTNGKGAFDERHPNAFTPLAAKELLGRCDTVLFVGTRGMDTRGNMIGVAAGATQLAINIDPGTFKPPRSYSATICGDARSAVSALGSMIGGERPLWVDDRGDVQQRVADELATLEPQLAYVNALRSAMPDDAVLVNELTQVGYVARYGFEVRHRRSYIDPGYQGTLGYGYPTAIGAAVGNPDRPVVSVNGDGGFGYGMAEMATAVNHNIPLVGIVFRDNAFGNVRRMHTQQFEGDFHGTELANPDMVALAKAFGIDGHQAQSPDELAQVLGAAIDARRPALIDVPMGVTPDPWSVVMKPWAPPAS